MYRVVYRLVDFKLYNNQKKANREGLKTLST